VRHAKTFDLDPRDILMELGKRKVIAGQEDIIIDVALYLKNKKKAKTESDEIEALL